jgi:hypothetical protein
MPNWCWNTLRISGKAEEIERFLNGLRKDGDRFLLLESYLPCPKEIGNKAYFDDIGYDTFFNPDPSGFLRVLERPEIREHGIKTREQLMKFVKDTNPKSYENGLKINNNLFKFGYRDWYDWSIANWGTKFEDSDTKLVKQDPTNLIFEFASPWNPPIPGLEFIAGLFPELEFYIDFADPMMGFRGFGHWVRGELVEKHCDKWIEFEEGEDVTKSSNLLLQQTEEGSSEGKQTRSAWSP